MNEFRLGDEFFLVSHDQLTGRPALSRRILGLGLVAALLGELMIDGRIALRHERVTLVDGSGRGDGPGDFLVDSIAEQKTPHPVRTWVKNLSDIAHELVARRLVERGTVRRVRARLLPRADTFPVAKREAVQPLLTLDAVLRGQRRPTDQQRLLTTLLGVAGVEHVLAADLDRCLVRAAVAELADGLPADLIELVAGFDATIVALSLSIPR